MKSLHIQIATPDEAQITASILHEAATYLDSIGQSLWKGDDLALSQIEQGIANGECYLAYWEGEAVGTCKFQLKDDLFWPEIPEGTSAFLHRLAVKRKVAGMGISTRMLDWAKQRARELDLDYLRLDCAIRPKLCALYERNGFVKLREKQVGPYRVALYEFPLKGN